MFRNYFADVSDGQLARLQYLGHWLLLVVIGVLAFYALARHLGIADQLLSGFPYDTDLTIEANLRLPVLVICLIIAVLLCFASLNIMAKRFRDMGLPGWLVVLGVAILSAVLSVYASATTAGLLGPVVWLVLVLVPSKNG